MQLYTKVRCRFLFFQNANCKPKFMGLDFFEGKFVYKSIRKVDFSLFCLIFLL
jgi:hypothetical protein